MTGLRAPDPVVALVAAALSFLCFAPFAYLTIDRLHDGILMKPAIDVASGQVLFRDTFSPYGVLTTWIQAIALRTLGTSLWSIRTTGLATFVLTAATLALTWSCFLPRAIGLLAVVLYVAVWPFRVATMVAWPSAYWLLFHSLAMLAAVQAFRSRHGVRWAAAAGAMAACAFGARQLPVGVMTLAATVGGLAAPRLLQPGSFRDAGRFAVAAAGGAAAVLGALAAILIWQGTLAGWFQLTIRWALGWRALHNFGVLDALVSLDRQWSAGLILLVGWILTAFLARRAGRAHRWRAAIPIVVATLVWTAAPLTTLVYAFYGVWPIGLAATSVVTVLALPRARRAAEPADGARLAALSLCLAAWVHLYPLGDPMHGFYALSASYGFVLLAAWDLVGRRTGIVVATVLGALVPYLWWLAPIAAYPFTHPLVTLTRPPVFAGMRMPPDAAAQWERETTVLETYTQQRPDWPLLMEIQTPTHNMAPLYGVLAPDLANPDAVPWAVLGLGYDADARARFVLQRRPVVLLPHDGKTSEPVQRAMETIGYHPLLRIQGAVIMVPDAG